MKLTKYGLPQVVIFPALIAVVGAGLAYFTGGILRIVFIIVFGIVFLWALSFFRDPYRKIKKDESVLLSPCDGTVTAVNREEGCVTVSVFLSLFSVHINRVPCSVKVTGTHYKKGEFRDARDPLSSQVNESNEVYLKRTAEPRDDITVRQVSGTIARHIVCRAKTGDTYMQGEKFGMIKFGSRTDLILRTGKETRVCVSPGDKVRAGVTAMVKYE